MVKHRNILLAVILLASPVLAGQTIDVASFGATPNDGKDDTAALLAAFAKCRGTKDATLVFADGQFDIKLPDRNHQGLLAEECAGLTIDGRGATLMFHSISSAIRIQNSANGRIEDNKIPPDRKGAGQTRDVVLDSGCDASTIETK